MSGREPAMRFFCTYFDANYLPRALALYRSLRRHCPLFQLYALCLDDASYRALGQLALPGVEPIALAEFERGDEALLAAKRNRSRVEYYFTCTPSLPLYVLARRPQVDLITYLDADLYFFADPAPLFGEIEDASVAITAHRFPPKLRALERYGRYNVGWISFRRDEHGLACLAWWRERCLEWCHDRVEPTRFADQKYLDTWPQRFARVVVLAHEGANVAPWNLESYALEHQNGAVRVNGKPLIFFHPQGLKQPARTLYTTHLRAYELRPSLPLMRDIYAPYIRTLASLTALRAGGNEPRLAAPQAAWARRPSAFFDLYAGILARECLFVRRGRLMWLDHRFRFVDLGPPARDPTASCSEKI